jgi:tyrosine-protein kinase Etk/Wzc
MNDGPGNNTVYDRFNTREYFGRIYSIRWIIMASLLLAFILAFVYTWYKSPLYRIQATVVIKDEKKGEILSSNIKELDFIDEQKIVDNEAEIIKSDGIISTVVEQQKLNIAYYKKNEWKKDEPLFQQYPFTAYVAGDISNIEEDIELVINDQQYFDLLNQHKQYLFGDTINYNNCKLVINKTNSVDITKGENYIIRISDPREVVQSIKNAINIVSPTKNSSLLNIVMLHPSPVKGKAIVEGIINEYNLVNTREKQYQTDTIIKLIDERLKVITGQLSNYESRAEIFKASKGITELSDNSKMFLEEVKNNELKKTEIQTRMSMMDALEDYITHSNTSIAPPSMGISDPVLSNNINQLNQLELEKKSLEGTTGSANSLVQVKQNQINQVRASIIKNIQLQKQLLYQQLNELKQQELIINRNITNVPGQEKILLEILREKSIRENIYTYLLQKREEASIRDVAVFQKMRLVDKPFSSARPVKPSKAIVFGTALFLGLLIPVIGNNILRSFANKITNPEEIENLSGLRIAGMISRAGKTSLYIFKQQNIITEQFRKLRTNLINSSAKKEGASILMITSVIPGEGKSFIAANLGIAFSLLGAKTLIIEADLRNPRLQKSLGYDDMKGFEEYLKGNDTDIFSLIYTHPEFIQLDILPASYSGNRSAELLSGDLSRLFNELRNVYDYILINTSPVSLFTDAMLLKKYADTSLIILRHNYTTTDQVKILSKMIRQQEFNNPLAIYNDVPVSRLYNKKLVRGKKFTYSDAERILE